MMDYNTLTTVCKMLDAQASYSQIRNRTGIGNSSITRVKRLLADSGISLSRFYKNCDLRNFSNLKNIQ